MRQSPGVGRTWGPARVLEPPTQRKTPYHPVIIPLSSLIWQVVLAAVLQINVSCGVYIPARHFFWPRRWGHQGEGVKASIPRPAPLEATTQQEVAIE